VALLNDHHWADDPAHASDNRWMHRPAMDWDAVARRGERDTIEWRVWTRHLALVHARRAEPTLGGGPATVLVQPNASVLAYSRGRPGSFVALVNFAVTDQMVSGRHLAQAGIERPRHLHSTTGHLELSDGDVEVPACGFVWLTTG
jgi:amylosucrase